MSSPTSAQRNSPQFSNVLLANGVDSGGSLRNNYLTSCENEELMQVFKICKVLEVLKIFRGNLSRLQLKEKKKKQQTLVSIYFKGGKKYIKRLRHLFRSFLNLLVAGRFSSNTLVQVRLFETGCRSVLRISLRPLPFF